MYFEGTHGGGRASILREEMLWNVSKNTPLSDNAVTYA